MAIGAHTQDSESRRPTGLTPTDTGLGEDPSFGASPSHDHVKDLSSNKTTQWVTDTDPRQIDLIIGEKLVLYDLVIVLN